MDRIFRQIVTNALNYMVYDEEKKYLTDTFGCKKTGIDLCRKLRQYRNDVAPSPRLEDFIRYHYRPCEEYCEYYLPYDTVFPILLYGFVDLGEILSCQKLYTVAMINAVEGRYPSEMELLFYEASSSIDDGIQQLQRNMDNIQVQVQEEQKSNVVIPESYLLKKNMEQSCCMCQESLLVGQQVITLPCMHTFHSTYKKVNGECVGIEPWLSTSNLCPLCKQSV